MTFRTLGLLAAALAALVFAQPAAAQTIGSLPLKGADSATYQEAGATDTGGRFYPGHLVFGWTGSALKAWTLDANGSGAVNVLSSTLPAGAATDAKLEAVRALLAGALTVTVTNPSSGGGAAVPTGTAGSPNAAVVTVQGASGGTGVPVTLASVPLAAGAASAANQATQIGSLASIATNTAAGATAAGQASSAGKLDTLHGDLTKTGGLPTADANGAAFQGEVAMTVGGPAVAAGRSLKVVCTAAGGVSVTYVDGTTGVWPVVVGTQTLPIAVTAVNTSGTTATAAFSNLK